MGALGTHLTQPKETGRKRRGVSPRSEPTRTVRPSTRTWFRSFRQEPTNSLVREPRSIYVCLPHSGTFFVPGSAGSARFGSSRLSDRIHRPVYLVAAEDMNNTGTADSWLQLSTPRGISNRGAETITRVRVCEVPLRGHLQSRIGA